MARVICFDCVFALEISGKREEVARLLVQHIERCHPQREARLYDVAADVNDAIPADWEKRRPLIQSMPPSKGPESE